MITPNSDIEQLEYLRRRKLISEDEFQKSKNKVLFDSEKDIDKNRAVAHKSMASNKIPTFENNYKIADLLILILFSTGWLEVVSGVFLAIYGIQQEGFMLKILIISGFSAIIVGLLQVGISQIIKTTVDNANYSREILRILHNRLK